MNYFISIALLLLTWNANAEEIFPHGCTPLVVTGELVTLPATKATITMIHNLSNMDLWITHPVSEPNASAGWSSRLQSGNWSALALNDDAFELSCIESSPGHEQQTPCSGVVAVCQWTATKMPKKSSGTYWAGEDMPLDPLIAYIKRRGFVFSEKDVSDK
mgnify:CR=1 FL=1